MRKKILLGSFMALIVAGLTPWGYEEYKHFQFTRWCEHNTHWDDDYIQFRWKRVR